MSAASAGADPSTSVERLTEIEIKLAYVDDLVDGLIRLMNGGFTPKQHFGFEAAAWYWHFVDVVWLFLFSCIYVWGSWGAAIEGAGG